MQPLRILKVIFDLPIEPHEIRWFRGAIAEKVGRKSVLFHNHLNDGTNALRYKYPLIQYKRKKGKACLVCIDDGVGEVHQLFTQKNWSIFFKGEDRALRIDSLNLRSHNLALGEEIKNYRLSNWLALNGHNHDKFKSLNGLEEQMRFLERILTSQILSFAKGVGWFLKDQLIVHINSIDHYGCTDYKGVNLRTFSVSFSSNAQLPNNIGLGKGVSKGFGNLLKQKLIPTTVNH